MPESARPIEETLPELLGGRYIIDEWVGQGGMALVARVTDKSTGEVLALKRMRTTFAAKLAERTEALFQREYRVLAELRHPRIVTVYDYGMDGEIPYYTMELLDGGDLFECAPLPWKQACAIGRDVCSALSLVHARRMVHRDLSPRNVRRTGQGAAKLIDFGAMVPMGSSKLAVCTPAVAAPEVIDLQPLDGRADLYALGATLYQTLTGRAPYPARTFKQLPQLWKDPLRPPSAYASEIPEVLDGLILELLQLDAARRPASAAEVSERLSAMAGLSSNEQLVVSQAYLTTPSLVGRDQKIERVRRRLQRLSAERSGGSLLVLGEAGVGRTRLMDACVLQAKLHGIAPVRVDGEEATGQRLEAATALASQLLEACPEQTLAAADPDWDVLCRLLPELRERAPARAVEELDPDVVHERALPALRDWLLAIAKEQPLLVAVDEVERLDAESRNLVALLSERSRSHPLLLLASRQQHTQLDCDALRMLEASSRELHLGPLALAESQTLLASIFGDVPNLRALARRLHGLASGNPRSLMQLSQHLLDQGIVRRTGGAWVLPADVDELSLPANMAEALQAIVGRLKPESRRLAQAMALTGEEHYDFEECLHLCRGQLTPPQPSRGPSATSEPSPAQDAVLYGNLAELVGASVVTPVGDRYRLAGREWTAPLLDTLPAPTEAILHERLAQVFVDRTDVVRAVRHMVRCGQETEAVEALSKHAIESSAMTGDDADAFTDFLDGLPPDWRAIYDAVLSCAERQDAPRKTVYVLRSRLLGIVSQYVLPSGAYTLPVARTLADEAGLDLYARLEHVEDPKQRLKQALHRAAARHEARAEHDKLMAPSSAIRHLARTTISAIGPMSNTLDVDEWEQMPSLAPLEPVSPTMSIVFALERGFDARLRGRHMRALDVYKDILERLASPEDVGLEGAYLEGMRAGVTAGLGILEAVLGLPTWRARVEAISDSPIHRNNALLIEGLAANWQGDVQVADALDRERELRRLELRRPRSYEQLALLWRFHAHVASHDLTRARRGLNEIERTRRKLPSWEPIYNWAQGEYERIRGDHAAALGHLDEALTTLAPGRHHLWAYAAGSRLLVLCSLRREAEARKEGAQQLAQAQAHELDHMAAAIHLPLAIAAARQGDPEAAWSHAGAALQVLHAYGIGGLSLGLAYEVAASVAVYLEDTAAFARYAPRCRELLLAHDNRTLASRYERLVRAAKRHELGDGEVALPRPTDPQASEQLSQLRSLLQTCAEPGNCLEACLELIAESAGAQVTYLFALMDGEPRLHSQSAPGALPEPILRAVRTFLRAELEDNMDTAASDEGTQGGAWVDDEGAFYLPLLLGHSDPSGFVISGVAVVKSDSESLPFETAQFAEHISRFMANASDFETQVSA
ncbi:MAG: serine/threonine-protein kinase [Myxococcales bacterium]|nr:serine/threonine-protein kinase [Myxococcales bacterium]